MNSRAILREPLLHFVALGATLFLIYGQVSPGDRDGKTITVGQRQVDGIVAQYQAQWNRPPTPAELRALVETQVQDEMLYREGKAMGLNDAIPLAAARSWSAWTPTPNPTRNCCAGSCRTSIRRVSAP